MNILPERSGGRTELLSGQGKGERHVLEWAREQIHASREDHERDFSSDAYLWYRHYRNTIQDDGIDPDDYHTNIGAGIVYPTVKLLSARMSAPWQAGDRMMTAIAMDLAGVDRAEAIAAWVNHKLCNGIPRMFSKCELTAESSLIFGRGVLKPIIRFVPQMSLLQRMALTIASPLMAGSIRAGSMLQWGTIPAGKRFDFDYVDPFNFWWVGSPLFENCDFSVEQSYLTTMACNLQVEAGAWPRSLVVGDGDASGYDEYSAKRVGEDSGAGDQVRAHAARLPRPHRLETVQGWVETKDAGPSSRPRYEKRVVQILDDKWLVVNERLGTWDAMPGYIVWEPSLDPAGCRPIGIIEPAEPVLLAINDFLNIGMDNCRKIVESALLVDPRLWKEETLRAKLGPGEMNACHDPTRAVAPVPMKDLPRSFYQMLGYLNDLWQKSTGASDYFGGLNTADSDRLTKTAKGMQLMANLAADRFTPILLKMVPEFYRQIAKHLHETARLRMREIDAEVVRLPSPPNPESPFQMVGPTELDANLNFAFDVKALDFANQRRRGEFLETLKTLGELAPIFQAQGLTLDAYETARILLEGINRGSDADRIVKSVQELSSKGRLPLAPTGGPFATPGAPMLPGAPMPPEAGPPMPPPPLQPLG